jgi:hypothetical protein
MPQRFKRLQTIIPGLFLFRLVSEDLANPTDSEV